MARGIGVTPKLDALLRRDDRLGGSGRGSTRSLLGGATQERRDKHDEKYDHYERGDANANENRKRGLCRALTRALTATRFLGKRPASGSGSTTCGLARRDNGTLTATNRIKGTRCRGVDVNGTRRVVARIGASPVIRRSNGNLAGGNAKVRSAPEVGELVGRGSRAGCVRKAGAPSASRRRALTMGRGGRGHSLSACRRGIARHRGNLLRRSRRGGMRAHVVSRNGTLARRGRGPLGLTLIWLFEALC